MCRMAAVRMAQGFQFALAGAPEERVPFHRGVARRSHGDFVLKPNGAAQDQTLPTSAPPPNATGTLQNPSARPLTLNPTTHVGTPNQRVAFVQRRYTSRNRGNPREITGRSPSSARAGAQVPTPLDRDDRSSSHRIPPAASPSKRARPITRYSFTVLIRVSTGTQRARFDVNATRPSSGFDLRANGVLAGRTFLCPSRRCAEGFARHGRERRALVGERACVRAPLDWGGGWWRTPSRRGCGGSRKRVGPLCALGSSEAGVSSGVHGSAKGGNLGTRVAQQWAEAAVDWRWSFEPHTWRMRVREPARETWVGSARLGVESVTMEVGAGRLAGAFDRLRRRSSAPNPPAASPSQYAGQQMQRHTTRARNANGVPFQIPADALFRNSTIPAGVMREKRSERRWRESVKFRSKRNDLDLPAGIERGFLRKHLDATSPRRVRASDTHGGAIPHPNEQIGMRISSFGYGVGIHGVSQNGQLSRMQRINRPRPSRGYAKALGRNQIEICADALLQILLRAFCVNAFESAVRVVIRTGQIVSASSPRSKVTALQRSAPNQRHAVSRPPGTPFCIQKNISVIVVYFGNFRILPSKTRILTHLAKFARNPCNPRSASELAHRRCPSNDSTPEEVSLRVLFRSGDPSRALPVWNLSGLGAGLAGTPLRRSRIYTLGPSIPSIKDGVPVHPSPGLSLQSNSEDRIHICLELLWLSTKFTGKELRRYSPHSTRHPAVGTPRAVLPPVRAAQNSTIPVLSKCVFAGVMSTISATVWGFKHTATIWSLRDGIEGAVRVCVRVLFLFIVDFGLPFKLCPQPLNKKSLQRIAQTRIQNVWGVILAELPEARLLPKGMPAALADSCKFLRGVYQHQMFQYVNLKSAAKAVSFFRTLSLRQDLLPHVQLIYCSFILPNDNALLQECFCSQVSLMPNLHQLSLTYSARDDEALYRIVEFLGPLPERMHTLHLRPLPSHGAYQPGMAEAFAPNPPWKCNTWPLHLARIPSPISSFVLSTPSYVFWPPTDPILARVFRSWTVQLRAQERHGSSSCSSLQKITINSGYGDSGRRLLTYVENQIEINSQSLRRNRSLQRGHIVVHHPEHDVADHLAVMHKIEEGTSATRVEFRKDKRWMVPDGRPAENLYVCMFRLQGEEWKEPYLLRTPPDPEDVD
ncbi:hypothetical protein C8R43DRAFT_952909 [Mycena crocata]|nr:hypothetical protein C8R43DRAFT_952909 [Mycena crocata]